ncbi:MAG: AraC family transcriptional regulator [Alkalispirochaeta sp.]
MVDFDRRNTRQRRIMDFSGTPLHDVEVVGRYNYVTPHTGPPTERFPRHLEIIYLEQGEQPYRIEGKEYQLQSNELLLVYPGERHSTGAVPEKRGRLYWIILTAAAEEERWMGLAAPFGGELLRRLLDQRLPRRFTAAGGVRGLLERVLSAGDPADNPGELRAKELWWALRMQHTVVECLLAIAASRETNPRRFPTGQILRVAEAMAARPAARWLIIALAEAAELSVPQFQRRFKEEIGLPPMEYLTRRRVERASNLLRETQLSVTQIALQVGFRSSQYFATVFRKFTGYTPTDYRRQASPAD